MNHGIRSACLLLAAVAALAAPISVRAQTWGQFGVDVLPMPVGSYSFGLGGVVNDAGQAAGGYFNGSFFEAFLWDGSSVQGLGTLGQDFSRAEGINASGQVSGYSRNSAGRNEAFRYSGGTMTGLGTLDPSNPSQESYGAGINASGRVTGYSRPPGASGFEAMVHDGSSLQGIGTLAPFGYSYGQAINDAGQVTGNSFNGVSGAEAFLYDGTTMLGLGTLGGNVSYGLAINNAGHVVGTSTTGTALGAPTEAFLWNGTAMLGLGSMGGTTSVAHGLTDAGQAVGRAQGGALGGSGRAVLWEGGTGYFLDALVGSGWTFTNTYGASGGGTLLALGTNASVNGGAETYVVLKQQADASSVVPEPSTWIMLATGLFGLGLVAWRRREEVEA